MRTSANVLKSWRWFAFFWSPVFSYTRKYLGLHNIKVLTWTILAFVWMKLNIFHLLKLTTKLKSIIVYSPFTWFGMLHCFKQEDFFFWAFHVFSFCRIFPLCRILQIYLIKFLINFCEFFINRNFSFSVFWILNSLSNIGSIETWITFLITRIKTFEEPDYFIL